MVQPILQPPPTVDGIPLQPGERVVYFVKPDYSFTKVSLLIFGLLFLVVAVGVFFLFARARVDRRNARSLVITTQRLLVAHGTGETSSLWLRDIARIEAIRFKSRSSADRLPPHDPRFWHLATGMTVTTRQGEDATLSCQDRPKEIWLFGLFLAQGLARGGFDQAPSVAYQA
jgi:hypothetical protein